MEQLWYLWFPLRMPQNALNAGFRDTNLSLEHSLADLYGDCVKTCNMAATLSLLFEL
jgi:hypothetical protein